MSLASGTRLAHYEIAAAIGKGGMGEVFRAKDTKLGRDVAIKVLPEEFTRDPERLGRFEREARVLASLNHPHIASIYGLEESDGTRFLAMELAEGEDLSRRIERGAIPIEEAIPIAVQIAEALEAAHEKGIIHRDLKPANIKLSDDGQVKLLDFGLAKALEVEEGDADLSNSPTMVRAATHAGVILGTAAYMSPEQARGKKVDKRADVWAFGVVLWEMLTGTRLFSGETVSDTLAAVLTREPDFSALPTSTPESVKEVIAACLEKDPKRRLRDVGDARLMMERPSAPRETPSSVRPASRLRLVAPVLGVALLAAAGGAWLARSLERSVEAPKRVFRLAPPAGTSSPRHTPTISPDGQWLAYIQDGTLFVSDLGSGDARAVPNSESVRYVTWSPDGTQLMFVAGDRIWKHTLASVQVLPVANVPIGSQNGGIAWADDGTIVFCSGGSDLLALDAGSGALKTFLAVDATKEGDFHEVSALPSGRGFVFVTHRVQGGADTIEVVSNGARKVILQKPGESFSNPVYSTAGYLIYQQAGRTGGLWAAPFSLEKLELTGPPVLIDEKGGAASASREGTLAYGHASLGGHRLVRVAPDGTYQLLEHDAYFHLDPLALSGDGTQILAKVQDRQNWDLWLFALEGDAVRRLTFSDVGAAAVWVPGREAVVYADESKLYLIDARGGAKPAELFEGIAPHVGPDGNRIAFVRVDPKSREDIWLGTLDGKSPPRPLLATESRERSPQISPDGKWLAYGSDESGREEIYLRSLGSEELKFQVSNGGGSDPQWNPDGTRLTYLEVEAAVMSVAVGAGNPISLSRPHKLFAISQDRLAFGHGYVALPGDKGFVGILAGETVTGGGGDVTVVTNWTADLGT